MVFIGNNLYESVTRCNKTAYLEKNSGREENQRTNGPENAHLRPEIYTNKLV